MSSEPKNIFDDGGPAVEFELGVVVDRIASSFLFNARDSGFGERDGMGGKEVKDLKEVVGSGIFEDKPGNTALLEVDEESVDKRGGSLEPVSRKEFFGIADSAASREMMSRPLASLSGEVPYFAVETVTERIVM